MQTAQTYRPAPRPFSGPAPWAPVITLVPRPTDSAALKALTRICPGQCFSFDAGERVAFLPEGCVLCGTCKRVCDATGEVRWAAPSKTPDPDCA